jgi:hypothetical protein
MPFLIFTSYIISISVKYWKQFYTPDFGNCYSYDLPEEVKELQVLEIKVEVHQAVNIFANHYGNFYSPDTRTKVVVKPHEIHSVEVVYVVSIISAFK